ncbi:MAG TPA: ABC transporter permease [Candidatus Angelobacter sp.]|nr:ABC transporter permease [Candidatus Angelobacter sp.]
MSVVAHDFRLAFRQLRQAPGFALIVVITLALGIGATTAIFSLVEAVLLRPLPFNQPDRLVLLGDHLGNGPNTPVTAREIGTYSKATSAFSSMGGYINVRYELTGSTTPEEIRGARFTAGVFPTLGVSPMMGRFFTQQEEDSHQAFAVISYALWLNRYHQDPHVLGASIALDRKAYTIIGVMPRDFEFPLQPGRLDQAQLWVPMSFEPDELADGSAGFWGYHMVARLKDGVTQAQAVQDADRVAQQIMRDFPVSLSAIHIKGDVTPLREYYVADARPLLQTLFFAVAVVLMIACINVAGLLLVRAIRRHGEYAVRLALGASSAVIIRGSIFEGVTLSMAGGLLGLAFAAIAIRAVVHILPESMPRINAIAMNASVAAFAVVLALASGVLCSLAPAFAALRTNLTQSLKQDVRTSTGGLRHNWLRSVLIVSEIAIALVLLTVSGAFLRSFQKMRAVDPGFTPENVLTAHYRLPENQYATNAAVETFNHAVVDSILRKPGIMAAGISNGLPSSGFGAQSGYTIEDQPINKWKLKFAGFAITHGDYFRTMGIPLLDGRTFTAADRSGAPLVIIVNESLAKHAWPEQRAIGKRMHIGGPRKPLPWATVVGVVADTKLGPRDEPSIEQWYMPAEQPAIIASTQSAGATEPTSGYIVLRSALPPEQMIQTLRATVANVDPLLALQEVQPMNDVISSVEAPRRFNTDLIITFAVGALLLAIIGIYAVIAFTVSQRSHEIAIRMALGAQRAGIARFVLISGAKLALLGCGLGVIGSLAVSRLIGSFLFEVSATDPLIYLACVLMMMLMALLASVIPATRAASADPIDALRSI